MKRENNSEGTLLPDAKNVKKQKKGKSSPSQDKPIQLPPIPPGELERLKKLANKPSLRASKQPPQAATSRKEMPPPFIGPELKKALEMAENDLATEPRAEAEKTSAYLVRLSHRTSNLIRWYCQITHHRPQHVVEGVMQANLVNAKEEYEKWSGDDSFDILLSQVLDAQLESVDTSDLLSNEFGQGVQVENKAWALLAVAALDAGCSVSDAASAVICGTLETLYNGKFGPACHRVSDWPAWERLNELTRQKRDKRLTSRRLLETAARS